MVSCAYIIRTAACMLILDAPGVAVSATSETVKSTTAL